MYLTPVRAIYPAHLQFRLHPQAPRANKIRTGFPDFCFVYPVLTPRECITFVSSARMNLPNWLSTQKCCYKNGKGHSLNRRYFQPYRGGERPGFRITYTHPVLKKQITRGLGTRDQTEAERLAQQVRELCEDSTLWDKTNPKLPLLDIRALAAFFTPTEIDVILGSEESGQLYLIRRIDDALKSLPELVDRAYAFAKARKDAVMLKRIEALLKTHAQTVTALQRRKKRKPR
jgi:hypothetical protein